MKRSILFPGIVSVATCVQCGDDYERHFVFDIDAFMADFDQVEVGKTNSNAFCSLLKKWETPIKTTTLMRDEDARIKVIDTILYSICIRNDTNLIVDENNSILIYICELCDEEIKSLKEQVDIDIMTEKQKKLDSEIDALKASLQQNQQNTETIQSQINKKENERKLLGDNINKYKQYLSKYDGYKKSLLMKKKSNDPNAVQYTKEEIDFFDKMSLLGRLTDNSETIKKLLNPSSEVVLKIDIYDLVRSFLIDHCKLINIGGHAYDYKKKYTCNSDEIRNSIKTILQTLKEENLSRIVDDIMNDNNIVKSDREEIENVFVKVSIETISSLILANAETLHAIDGNFVTEILVDLLPLNDAVDKYSKYTISDKPLNRAVFNIIFNLVLYMVILPYNDKFNYGNYLSRYIKYNILDVSQAFQLKCMIDTFCLNVNVADIDPAVISVYQTYYKVPEIGNTQDANSQYLDYVDKSPYFNIYERMNLVKEILKSNDDAFHYNIYETKVKNIRYALFGSSQKPSKDYENLNDKRGLNVLSAKKCLYLLNNNFLKIHCFDTIPACFEDDRIKIIPIFDNINSDCSRGNVFSLIISFLHKQVSEEFSIDQYNILQMKLNKVYKQITSNGGDVSFYVFLNTENIPDVTLPGETISSDNEIKTIVDRINSLQHEKSFVDMVLHRILNSLLTIKLTNKYNPAH